MALSPLPELTPSVPATDAVGCDAGSLVPAGLHHELDVRAAAVGASAPVGFVAALCILLERYAGPEEVPPIGVGVVGHGSRRISVRSFAPDTFDDVIARVHRALSDPAHREAAGPQIAGGVVSFSWDSGGTGHASDVPDVPDVPGVREGVAVSVTEPSSEPGSAGLRLRVVDGGRRTPRADAIERDLLTILAALARSAGPVAALDAFARPRETDCPASHDDGCHRLVDLVARHASRTPDKVAVRGEHAVTYAEVHRGARRVCIALHRLGVGVEERVGLLFERDERLAVGLLGVQLSGAAFVPVSSEDPPHRQREILADAGARVVVTTGGLAEHLEGVLRVVRVEECLDPEAEVTPAATLPAHAAYVLYTSGSSGKPKGVVVEHRQLLAYVEGFLERVGSEAGPLSCALVQPLTVDSSLTCIGAAWATGGELQVIDRATALDGDELGRRLRSHPADILKIAPSHLQALQAGGDISDLMPTTALVVGGEASDWKWLQEVDDTGACAVFNHYGPTETTVGVLMLPVRDHRGRGWTTAALGLPLRGCQVGVVDEHGNEVPAGIRGEIVVRGALVARGYQESPAESGFRPWRGEHAYWTGDMGIREHDGVIRFAGRADDQVKVRGYRVELGEIERAVTEHPAVVQAAALIDDSGDGAAVLGCAVRTSAERPPSSSELAAHCRSLLPPHMVPSIWVHLDEIPRSAHGKIDRRQLRERMGAARRKGPGVGRTTPEPGALPTSLQRGGVRQHVADAWTAVLDAPVTGDDINFFDAGGHSLLLLDLQRELLRRTGRDVGLLDLFQHPTILGQVELLQDSSRPGAPQPGSGARDRREALLQRRKLRQTGHRDE
jgi:amino acid adenylation domain-containing protein